MGVLRRVGFMHGLKIFWYKINYVVFPEEKITDLGVTIKKITLKRHTLLFFCNEVIYENNCIPWTT